MRGYRKDNSKSVKITIISLLLSLVVIGTFVFVNGDFSSKNGKFPFSLSKIMEIFAEEDGSEKSADFNSQIEKNAKN